MADPKEETSSLEIPAFFLKTLEENNKNLKDTADERKDSIISKFTGQEKDAHCITKTIGDNNNLRFFGVKCLISDYTFFTKNLVIKKILLI